jgi:hypothetical protein
MSGDNANGNANGTPMMISEELCKTIQQVWREKRKESADVDALKKKIKVRHDNGQEMQDDASQLEEEPLTLELPVQLRTLSQSFFYSLSE